MSQAFFLFLFEFVFVLVEEAMQMMLVLEDEVVVSLLSFEKILELLVTAALQPASVSALVQFIL